MIYEYVCPACGRTFIGDGEAVEEHFDCPFGPNNFGELVVEYTEEDKK